MFCSFAVAKLHNCTILHIFATSYNGRTQVQDLKLSFMDYIFTAPIYRFSGLLIHKLKFNI